MNKIEKRQTKENEQRGFLRERKNRDTEKQIKKNFKERILPLR